MLDRSETCYWEKGTKHGCVYGCACCAKCTEYESLCDHCVVPRLCTDEELKTGGCEHFSK